MVRTSALLLLALPLAASALETPLSRRAQRHQSEDLFGAQLALDMQMMQEAGYNISEALGASDELERLQKTLQKRAATTGFNYGGSSKVRGVNLGGWLVSEPFIKPSLFLGVHKRDSRIVDEYTFCRYHPDGRAAARAALMQHWASWMTEADIKAIAAAGLNHVRIPIGYWALGVVPANEYYISGALYYLKLAVLWAGRANLRVLIDLHGAPGSQNGFDNSGRQGPIEWHTSADNVARTKKLLLALVAEFQQSKYTNIVTAIQPLNEPAGFVDGVLPVAKQYYLDSYKIVRFGGTSKANKLLFNIHDVFVGLSYWTGFMAKATSYSNVMSDTHIYTMFDDVQIKYTDAQRIQKYCSYSSDVSALSAGGKRPIVGEWTAASTDCSGKIPGITYKSTDTVKGLGGGARYDGTAIGATYKVGSCTGKTGSGANFSSAYKASLRKFYEVQTTVYERGSGWIMWTWKMESGDDWSYQAGLKYGWIPKNPTEKKYGNQC
ncbi:glycoside hydrolase superfamily [Leucosporidium creatinivorum]|uniref:Glycoside hydrolase superfamily n=1 Tax=Leucosporidium creatinivorum TaxID=106004 RepID=A0A1Y2EW48_9BASI|nr:glycoside hydrolase superfamily [Leucosporidium creatinivorum]